MARVTTVCQALSPLVCGECRCHPHLRFKDKKTCLQVSPPPALPLHPPECLALRTLVPLSPVEEKTQFPAFVWDNHRVLRLARMQECQLPWDASHQTWWADQGPQ